MGLTKVLVIILLGISSISALPATAIKDITEHIEWETYKDSFEKKYEDVEEEIFRKILWQSSRAVVEQHNKETAQGLHTYTMDVNQFADSFLEIPQGFMLSNASSARKDHPTFQIPRNVVIPKEVDWRKDGLVTHVKNQWFCGSCWAFSSTGAIEGQVMKKTGKLISLSEQQLVDCDKTSHGCSGGLMEDAFDYIKSAGGIESSHDYHYWGLKLWCHFKKQRAVAQVSGYTFISEGDEDALMKAVATVGPISVAIHADQSLMFYRSGVYSNSECPNDPDGLNHAVLVAGYGEENGVPYWLVKNSWGKSWGDHGYIKMKRNAGNMCGIATHALYPLV